MAAAATDKLMEVGIATATTLDANYTINDTSITVASTSGWPTATGVTFAIDVVDSAGVQVAGTYNEYIGVVSSATSITSVDHVNGTDRNYSAGATTRVMIVVTAERENRIVEWGLEQHKQDGTHADTITTNTINENTPANGVTIDGLNIKDSAITTANSVPNSAIQDWPWQSWTPTLSGRFNDSKWTKACTYREVGTTIEYRLTLTANAGTPMDGGTQDAIFTLPVTSRTYNADELIGVANAGDAGTTIYTGVAVWASTTTARLLVGVSNATYLSTARYEAGVPFTWVSGDTISVFGSYEKP